MENFIIRRLREEDASQVAELIRQLTPNIVDPHNLETRMMVSSMPGGNHLPLVAQSDGRIVGHVELVWFFKPSKGICGRVEEMVVDKNSRRGGIATALMNAVDEYAAKLGLVQIELAVSNPHAIRLYEKMGYVKRTEDHMIKRRR